MTKRLLLGSALVWCFAASSAAVAQTIIYDNGSTVPSAILPIGIITNPGAAVGGADGSQITAPDNTFGHGHQTAAGNRLVDDFVVPAGFTWTITGAHVFGYVTGATTVQTTFGAAQFFNAQPTVGSVPIFGDTTTNVFTSGTFTNIYRTTAAAPLDATRRVVDNTLTFGAPLVLGPGTYWFEYGLTGNNFSPSLQVTPNQGGVVTGNGLQFTTAGGYLPLLDPAGTGVQKGVAFQLVGTIAPIPEPGSMALVGLAGLVGCGYRRWKGKK